MANLSELFAMRVVFFYSPQSTRFLSEGRKAKVYGEEKGGKRFLLPFLRERLQRFRVDESKSTDRQNGQSTGAENTTEVHELWDIVSEAGEYVHVL